MLTCTGHVCMSVGDNSRVPSRANDARVRYAGRTGALPERVLALIATGQGGGDLAGIAAHLTAEVVSRRFAQYTRAAADVLPPAFAAARRALAETASRHTPLRATRNGCTAVMLHDEAAYCTHASNARVYLARAGQLLLMTEEHERSDGDRMESSWPRPLRLRPGDQLLLCSPAISAQVSDERLLRVLETTAPHDTCSQILHAVRVQNHTDHLAAVLLTVGVSASGEPAKQVSITQGAASTPVRV